MKINYCNSVVIEWSDCHPRKIKYVTPVIDWETGCPLECLRTYCQGDPQFDLWLLRIKELDCSDNTAATNEEVDIPPLGVCVFCMGDPTETGILSFVEGQYVFTPTDGQPQVGIDPTDYQVCVEPTDGKTYLPLPYPEFCFGPNQTPMWWCPEDGSCISIDPLTKEQIDVAINQGQFTTSDVNSKIDIERFNVCFTDADSPVDLAVIEAAMIAHGATWDNGDAFTGLAADNAVLTLVDYSVARCGNKKPDGTAIGFDGSEALCAVEVLNEAGTPVGVVNGGGGDTVHGTVDSPADIGSFVINADPVLGTAALFMCVEASRRYDKSGAVIALSTK